MKKAVVVAGPTASGKSALALALAERFDGVVINADSMQVYRTLRVLTARPGPAEEARAPHRLYGILGPDELCSAGRWRALAQAACDEAWAAGRLPVVTGGTGLYIRALVDGLSPVPEVPDDVRTATRRHFAALGNVAFHAELARRDPAMAARLDPGNSQRLMRAWEVLEATGRSLADWQAEPPADRLDARVFTVAVMPPRDALYASCDQRFLAMLDGGALDEVRALMALNLDPSLPAMKALGVAELIALAQGRLARNEAVAAAQQATRRYAKRQLTWFRHQLDIRCHLDAQFSESFCDRIFANIHGFLLTEG